MKNIKYVMYYTVALLVLSACNKTPTVDDMLADPELREKTSETCKQVSVFNPKDKNFALCKVWGTVSELCFMNNPTCKKSKK